MNIAIFTGRIGKKDLFETPSGDVITFSIAINDNYKNKEGNWVERTHWVKVAKWKPSELIKGISKGDEVLVEAKIEENEWTKDDGTKQKFINFNARSIKRIATSKIGDKKGNEQNYPESDDIPF